MNSNEEQQFAYRIRQILNKGTDTLAPEVVARLLISRRKAMNPMLQEAAVTRLSLAGMDGWTLNLRPLTRILAMALALSVGGIGSYYWNQFSEAAENEEVDSALLSDELPPDAYVDSGFKTWLQRASDSSQQ